MDLIINIVTLILCVVILTFGGIQTVKKSDIQGMEKQFEIALESGPDIPTNNEEETEKPEDSGEDEDGKDSEKPENPDDTTPSDPVKPDDSEEVPPEEPVNPEDPKDPADPEKPEEPENPDEPLPNPPHEHKYVDGKCECGEVDTDYVTPEDPKDPNEPEKPEDPEETPKTPALSTDETKDAFKEMYDSHDPDFTEVKKEILTDMITGILSSDSKKDDDSTDNENEDNGEGGNVGDGETDDDFEDDFGFDFGTEFNPDEFVPDDLPEDEETDDDDEMVSDVVNIYFDNLINEIEKKQNENADKPAEEGDADGQAFVEKEAEALAGLVNIIDTAKSGDTPDDSKILQSVDAILDSNVCMDTVSTSTDVNSKFTEKAQEATQNISDETKAEIQQKIETSLEEYRASEGADGSKEKQYTDLANLFGITLNNASGTPSIPDVEIPEDFIN